MKFVLPRVIHGNRGDLLSRWGVICALNRFNENDVTVFADAVEEVPPVPLNFVPYAKFFNLLLRPSGWQTLRKADVVLWAVGLDIQDESSIAKLFYLDALFTIYKCFGLRIWCVFQGAGPLSTSTGKTIAKRIIRKVDLFVARDPGTHDLIKNMSPDSRCLLAHDAIFLPGIEMRYQPKVSDECRAIATPATRTSRPHIGFNIRQWYHFASRFLPYQFRKERYRRRSAGRMKELVVAASHTIQSLRDQFDARILLFSAYQSNLVQWEDDLPWLEEIKRVFLKDPEVILVDNELTISEYVEFISQLDLMVGMRLHSCLIALRTGVPAVNINYSLKGRDIMRHLSLDDRVIELEDFMSDPYTITAKVRQILTNGESERMRVRTAVNQAVEYNQRVLKSILSEG